MTTDKNFRIEWNCQPEEGRNDAVWYHGVGFMGKAILTTDAGELSLDIYCDGETLVKIPYDDEDFDHVEYVRYPDQFESMGIRNDEDLVKMNERWANRDIWVYNSWFDFYIDGEHIDYVTHEIPDAVAGAEVMLLEVAAAGGWKNYFAN